MTMLLRHFLRHPNLIKGKAARWDWGVRGYRQDDNLRHKVLPLVPSARIVVIEIPEGDMKRAWVPGDKPVSPPFPLCWLELYGYGNDRATLPITMIKDEGLTQHVSGLPDPNHMAAAGPVGMLVHEVRPGVCDFYVMELTCDVPDMPPGTEAEAHMHSLSVTYYPEVDASSDASQWPPVLQVAHEWLQRINDGAMAVEETKQAVLIPRADRPHKRKPHEIRQIVRIMPRALYDRRQALPVTPGGIIDWSHRWEVRGHWRRVHGIGKDRTGAYVVTGFTWVKNFTKGPHDKPLVIKTRVALDLGA